MSDGLDLRRMQTRTALRLCAQLIAALPSGIDILSWEVAPGYLGGQVDSSDWSFAGAGWRIEKVASALGLAPERKRRPSLDTFSAAGEIDGIQVHIWTHLEHPAGETPDV